MADLGNLFFSLGLNTESIDKAWTTALAKYGKLAKIDLKVDTKELSAAKEKTALINEAAKQTVITKKAEGQVERDNLKTLQQQAMAQAKINTESARAQSIHDKTTSSISRTNNALTTQNRLMGNLRTMAASYISIFAAGRLLKELVQIGGEFEMQKVSLRAILGDLEGANAIFVQIQKLAVKSPFQFKDLISYTKQLSAFSVPMNELYDTTKMLADMSAGLGVGMDRLVLAYGQIRAASFLRGQEVRQLTEAGVPILEILRKQFELMGEAGITAGDVFDKISARQVPFDMVKKAFIEMTSEGGKFYKMQEIQSETLKGKVSNLIDAYQIMFGQIAQEGSATNETLKWGVDAVRLLMTNYEAIGKIIVTLAATYGVYQTALLITAIANGTLATSNGLLVTSFFAVRKAMIALTTAMAANPYVALAMGITTVIGIMWALRDSSTSAEKAQKKLDETMKSLDDTKTKMAKDVSGLINTIRGETSSVYEQVKAWDELIKRYVFFGQYSKDDLRKMTTEQKDALIASFTQQTSKESLQKALQNKQKEIADLNKSITKEKNDKRLFGGGVDDKAIKDLSDSLAVAKTEALGLESSLWEINRIEKEATFQTKPAEEQERLLVLKKETLEAQKAIAETDFAESKSKDRLLESLNSQIDKTTTKLADVRKFTAQWGKDVEKYITSNKIEALGFSRKTGEDPEEYIKRIKEEYGNLTELIASRSKLAGEDVSGLRGQLKSLAGIFKVIGISPTDSKGGDKVAAKAATEIEKAEDKLIKLEVDLEEKVAAAKVAAMEDGWGKEEAKRTLEHEKNIADIKQRANELLAAQVAAGGSGTALTPTNQAAIGSLLGFEDTRYSAEQNDLYKKLLSKYQDYADKKREIEQNYGEEVMQLVLQMNGKNGVEIGKALKLAAERNKKELSTLADDEMNEAMKSSPLLIKIFSDAANMGHKRLKETIALTKQLLAYISGAKGALLPEGITPEDAKKMIGDPVAIKSVTKSLHDLNVEDRKKTEYPLSGFVNGFKALKDAADLAKESVEGLTAEEIKQKNANVDDARVEGIRLVGAGMTSLGGILDGVSNAMTRIGEATKNMKLKEAAEQIKSIANVVTSAGEGAKSGSWAGAIIGAATSIITQTIEAFAIAKEEDAEYKQNQIDWLNNYKNTLLQIKDIDYESIFGIKALERSSQAIKNATEALKEYNDALAAKNAPIETKEQRGQGLAMFLGVNAGSSRTLTKEYKTQLAAYKKGYTDLQASAVETKKKGGFANAFGAKNEYKSLFDLAPDLWNKDLNGEFNAEAAKAFLEVNTQISDEQRKQIENLIKQKDLYDENVNIIKEDLKDTFGALGDALTDSIVSAITTGADAFSLFEEAGAAAIERLGEKLMYEIFFAAKFDKLQTDLLNTTNNPKNKTPEDIANEQMNIVNGFFNTIGGDMDAAVKWGELWKAKANEHGFDTWTEKGTATSNLGTAIKEAPVTENTANLLGSYINAMRADGSKRTMLVEKITPLISNINDTMGNGLAHLAAISSNTFRSANNTDAIVEKLNALTSRGGATKLNVYSTV